MKPTAVLVEGPSDATDQIKHLVHKDTSPPLAILCYTKVRPVRSILYPLASYSPEWAALTWGIRNKADTRFIDLPSSVFLGFNEPGESKEKKENDEESSDNEGAAKKNDPPSTRQKASQHTLAYLDDPYEEIARLSGDPDHETWWERHFEHTTDPQSYMGQIFEFGKGLREVRAPKENDETLIREAFMRKCIHSVLKAGHKAEKVLVVCGAFHSPTLIHELPPMTADQQNALPKVDAALTLMPYSYFRLSAQSGYGAGNHAPNYYQKLFEERRLGHPDRLPARFLSELAHYMRKAGHIRSAAEVIEAVRLATSLAALNDAPSPCLRDLRDAATTCLGRGEYDSIRPMLIEAEVGTAVGKLPKGISRTSIQDDFYFTLENLKLDKYQTEKAQELVLDLREDRFIKTQDLAFRDLNRSTFFHRLNVLDIKFAERQTEKGDNRRTWKEIWKMRWTPESEIQLVEGALLGDSIETAAAVKLAQRLQECERIDNAALLVRQSADCQLADALENARRHLQAMAVEATNFVQLAGACENLAEVIRYGSVRKLDPEPLQPLLGQLFLRATLGVRSACLCDEAAAREQIAPAIVRLTDVSREHPNEVDGQRWQVELDAISASDNLNAYVSGFVMSLILPRVEEEQLAREVNRRLSPGIPPDVGANWFEGLVQYNREALFARLALWRQLDAYVQAMDENEFRRALVPLRRAFGTFAQGQVRRVVSNLVEISQVGAEELKQSVDVKLSDEEAKQLQETLRDLDLGL
jgi:hypothetical protein